MSKRKTATVDRKPEIFAALEQFKEGDRVFNRLTKQHGYFHSPNYSNAMPECWVKYQRLLDDEWRLTIETPTDPLSLELCSDAKCFFVEYATNELLGEVECLDTSTFSPELGDLPLPQNEPEELTQPSSLKMTQMPSESLEATGDISPSTQTSDPTNQNKNLMLPPSASPAQIHPSLEIEKESMENLALSGLKPCESSMNASPDLSLSKTPQDYSIEEWEQSFKAYPKAGIFANGRLFPQQPLERPIAEKGYLSLPTLTSGDKTPNSRPAGQTKCEIWFRKKGLLADSQCLSPQMMALLQGFPKDWTKCLWESQEENLVELKADTSTGDVFAPPKQELSGNESNTSIISLPELSIDEERDLAHLERKVERAFYEAGKALEEIRDRKLYRASHKTFENYCKDRFGYSRRKADYAIAASCVVDNLRKVGGDGLLPPSFSREEMRTNCSQILPTNECQVRNLINLEPDEQRQIWQEAVEQSNGKIPTGAKVKGIVERLKEKNFIPLRQRSELSVGDVVKVKAQGNSTLRPYDGYWGIIERISDYFYHLCISVKNEVIQCKGDEVKRQDLTSVDRQKFIEISDRIKKLQKTCELDDADDGLLELMQRRTVWTDRQLLLLKRMEEDYGINKCSQI